MTKIRNCVLIVIMILLFIFTSHLEFLAEVQKGKAIDAHGNVLTMQECTWFTDKF